MIFEGGSRIAAIVPHQPRNRYITTGNIKNAELEALFTDNLNTLITLLIEHAYVELSRDEIITHQ
jgi:predicted nuclease of predicted toxin-antitoxin system